MSADTQTRQLTHIITHSLGLDDYGRGRCYRDYYVAGPALEGTPMRLLVDRGHMKDHGPQKIYSGDRLFTVTYAGKRWMLENVPPLPKMSKSKLRYQEYLRCGECFDNFLHFLQYTYGRKEREV